MAEGRLYRGSALVGAEGPADGRLYRGSALVGAEGPADGRLYRGSVLVAVVPPAGEQGRSRRVGLSFNRGKGP